MFEGLNWLWIIVVGAIAGLLADMVVPGVKVGLLGAIIAGILGGLLGGWIFGLLGLSTGGLLGILLAAFVGAIIVLLIKCDVGAKGNTASGKVTKPCSVEGGYELAVPLFVNEGDIIRIDTRTGEYADRVRA